MAITALHAKLGLVRNPFPPTPDAECYFFTEHLHEQLAELSHCIEVRKGFMLLTGEVGLGKSTLVRRLMESLSAEHTRTALVLNTFLQGADLLASILRDFGVAPGGSLDEDLSRLNRFLLDRHREGITCLLIVDDAQNLEPASLELMRLLCNLETAQEKLLQILLAGQPELEVTLAAPSLRQLQSRIVKHVRLCELSLHEVSRYFDFRANAAGAAGRIGLQTRAARVLHVATGGNLRHIHLVLDRCLYGLSATGSLTIDPALVRTALDDVSIQRSNARRGYVRSRPFALMLAAILGVATVAAGASWVRSNVGPVAHPNVLTVAPATVLPVQRQIAEVPATQPVKAVSEKPVDQQIKAAAARDQCVSRLQAQGAIGRQEVSAHTAQELGAVDGLCWERQDGRQWVVWHSDAGREAAPASASSAAVLSLQHSLTRHGLMEVDEVDGLYGAKTASALAKFQAARSLPISVTPDALTLMLLDRS